MAGYDINVGRDLLPGLLSGQNGLAKLVETVLNQILEAQVAEAWEQIGTSVQTSGRATATAIGRAHSTLALARSPCKYLRRVMAVFRPTSSSAISAANKRSCWP